MITPVIPDLKKIRQTDNPYSALFDYETLAQEEEARKKQAQAGQQKIMRTNAIGDALRTIIEGATGAAGASIAPRAVNPGIMQASQRFNALEDQSRENMERLRLQDLSMKKAAIDYKLGREAEASRQSWEAGQTEAKNRFAESQLNKELGSREKINAEDNASLEKRARIAGQYSVERTADTVAGRYELEKLKQSQQTDAALAKKGLFKVARYDTPGEDAIISRNQVVALLPELKKWALSKGLYPLPKVLQNDEFGSSVPDDQLKILIGQYGEFFKPRLAELSGGEDMLLQQRTYNTPLLPGYVPQGNKIPYNGPLRPAGTAQAQAPQPVQQIQVIKPDKDGNTDLSLLFN